MKNKIQPRNLPYQMQMCTHETMLQVLRLGVAQIWLTTHRLVIQNVSTRVVPLTAIGSVEFKLQTRPVRIIWGILCAALAVASVILNNRPALPPAPWVYGVAVTCGILAIAFLTTVAGPRQIIINGIGGGTIWMYQVKPSWSTIATNLVADIASAIVGIMPPSLTNSATQSADTLATSQTID